MSACFDQQACVRLSNAFLDNGQQWSIGAIVHSTPPVLHLPNRRRSGVQPALLLSLGPSYMHPHTSQSSDRAIQHQQRLPLQTLLHQLPHSRHFPLGDVPTNSVAKAFRLDDNRW